MDDRFAWLEENTAETSSWEDAQSQAARLRLDTPFRQQLRELIGPYVAEAAKFAPQPLGKGWLIYSMACGGTLEISDTPRSGCGRTVLRATDFAQESETASLDCFFPSPDGSKLVFGVSTGGDEQTVLRIMDLKSGAILPHHIRNASNTTVAWSPDSACFFFSAGEGSDFENIRKHIFRFDLVQDAQPLKEQVQTREQYSLKPQVSADGRWLAAMTSEIFPRPDFIRRLPDGNWEPFLVDVPGQCFGHFVGDRYIAISTAGGHRGRLVSIPVDSASDMATWSELRGESDLVLRSIELCGDYLVVTAFKDAAARLLIFGLDGSFDHEVDLPGDGVVKQLGLLSHYQLIGYGGENIAPGNGCFAFVFSTLVQSPAIYTYDIAGRRLECIEPARFDHREYKIQLRHAPGKDGWQIPYRFIRKADAVPGSVAPTIMYGYGGFNVSFIPGYLGALSAFIEAGGAVAFCHLRGGAEYGLDQWHGGRMSTKSNTIDDFICVAEDLVERGDTKSDILAAIGASGGGLLTGAAVARRPDLWAAVCSMVPLYDMLNYTRDPYTAVCALDLGDPGNPEAEIWLRGYSPYHQLAPAAYPAMLVTAAENDMRCLPWHARKFVARIQHQNTGPNDQYFLLLRSGGHMGTMQDPERVTDWLGFVMTQLGMDNSPTSEDIE
ncbi:prolyl oligopeptidase family serine peptidase [Hyphomonas sp.]|uniref:prolyl oligopeptidase family serine peptidase n=1 Tax=Hyphomonas sp. TaxID=87 RepID=UPI003918EEA2